MATGLRLALATLALATAVVAQEPKPLEDLCPSGSTRYGPYRVKTIDGTGTCLCNSNYACTFDVTVTVNDPLPEYLRVGMIYGAFFGAPGCGGKGLVYINDKLELTADPNAQCVCSSCETGTIVKTGFFPNFPNYENWIPQSPNKIRIKSDGGSYCVNWLEYFFCAVQTNKAPLCADDPITRTIKEVASRDAGCSGKGTNVGIPFLCSGPETNEKVTYEISGGNQDGAFAIDATTGQITINTDDPKLLSFEVRPTRAINVTATDNNKDGPRSTVKTVTIILTDCEDAPVVTDTTFAVNENAPAATTVGSVIATDEDRDSVPLKYQIMAGSDNVFTIDANTGTVRVSGNLNFEVKSQYVMTIRVTGGQGVYSEGKMTVNINDINDAPVLPQNVALNLPEDTIVNSPIGGPITATDEDRPRQLLTYSIVSGADGYIGITQENGQLMLIKKVTFTERQGFTLAVRAVDNGTPPMSATTTVTIKVLDTNDAPVWVSPFARSVDENSPVNTAVGGPAIAIEPDTTDAITYSIQANEGPFAINGNSGQLSVKIAELDYERQDQYTILLRASDQHGAFTDQLFTININDVNDPPVFRDQVRRIDENSAVDARVGEPLVATDDDLSTVLVFSIVSGNTGSAFKLGANGQLLVARTQPLDYETTPKFTLIITVTDGIAPVNATVTVFLNDVNDPPICQARTLSVNENSPMGTRVGTPVTCYDPDVGDSVHYRLASSSTVFNLDGTAQIILLSPSLDYEDVSMRQFVLNALAVDNSLAETQYTVTINVLDVNEAPVWVGGVQYNVSMGALAGSTLSPATLRFIDPDTTQQQELHYRVDDSNSADARDASNYFSVDADSGEVKVKDAGFGSASLPRQFLLAVIATDSGSPTGQTSATITINVLNKNVQPSCGNFVLSVQENSLNKIVGNIKCSDPENSPLEYSIEPLDEGTAADAFKVEIAGDGVNVVADKAVLNYELQNQYVYKLTAREVAVPTNMATSTLTINVEDVNEPPIIMTSTLFAVAGLRAGNTVGTIEVNDPERTRVELRIVSGNSGGVFAIQHSTHLVVASGKVVSGNPDRYPMNIEAKDAGGLTYDRIVTVQVCRLAEDEGTLPICPPNVNRNSGSGDGGDGGDDGTGSSSSSDSSNSDTAAIIIAVVLGLLCVVLVVLIVLARRNQNANTQVYAVNQGANKSTTYDMGQEQTEINPAFDDPNADEAGGNFDEF